LPVRVRRSAVITSFVHCPSHRPSMLGAGAARRSAFGSGDGVKASDMVQRTAGALTAASQEAVKTLLVLQKEPLPPAVRLGAARAVLEMGLKMREQCEIEQRLSDLEQRVSESSP
jgi:hypothetical protein